MARCLPSLTAVEPLSLDWITELMQDYAKCKRAKGNILFDNNTPCIVTLPKIEDPRGNLSFLEEKKHVPFAIERVYWIYDVPGGQIRGGHAFKEQQELIVAVSGSFTVMVDDGSRKQSFPLNRSYYGLYIPCGYWRQLEDFSTNSLALVISSTKFDEADYIRDYEQFILQSKNKI